MTTDAVLTSVLPGVKRVPPVARVRRNDIVALRVLAFMVTAPLVLGVIAYGVNIAFGGRSTGNPVITAAAALLRLVVPSLRGDSWTPMLQALSIAHGPEHDGLYRTLFFDRHEKFQYPPTSLLWLDGLRHLVPLTPNVLNRINGGVFVANAIGCMLLFRRLAGRGRAGAGASSPAISTTILVGLLSLTFWPVVYGFTIGQIQLWIDCLFTFTLLFWSTGRKLAAGIAVGLICTIKPQLGLLLLWALAWREYRFALGLLGVAGVAALLSVGLYGLASHVGYLDVLSYLARHGESFRANQSVNGLLNRMLFNGNNLDWLAAEFPPFRASIYWPTLITGLLFSAVPFLGAIRRRQPGVVDLCVAGLCFTMASPIAWEQHYGPALPIFIVCMCSLISMRPEAGTRTALGLLLGAWCLMGSNLQMFDLLSATTLNVLQSYVFFGALLLLGVLLFTTGRSRRQMPVVP